MNIADLQREAHAITKENLKVLRMVHDHQEYLFHDVLARVPAKVRFLSAEPLLGPLDLTPWLKPEGVTVHSNPGLETRGALAELAAKAYQKVYGLQWVIVGGESGPGARPMHPDWVRSIRDQCLAAGVPFFLKQWGEWSPWEPFPGGDLGGDMRRGIVEQVHGDGRPIDGHFRRGDCYMRKVGKKAAGALLDGREWREMPASR